MSDYGRQLSKIIEVQQKLKDTEFRVSGLIDEVDKLRNILRFIGKVVNKDRSVKFIYQDISVPLVVVPVSLTNNKKGELTLRGYDLHRMIYADYLLSSITPIFPEENQE